MAAAASSDLLAGAASRVITPQKPVYLAGLKGNRLSDGVHDDLFARALLLQQGDTTLILAGLDVIGYPRRYVLDVQNALRQRGVPAEHVILCSTHQHSGPDTIGIWGPSPTETGVDPEYMDFLAGQIVEAIAEAYAARRPANVALGVGTVPPGVVRNVRIPGYFDDALRVLRFTDAEGETIATLVNATAHPETLWSDNTKLTADYPQHIYRIVEQRLGGMALFVNGALGGMVTVDARANTFEEAERIGSAVADTAVRAAREAQPVENPTLRVQRRVFATALDNERFRAGVAAGVIPLASDGGTFDTEVNLIRIGRAVAMATVPGELLPKLGFWIRDAARERLGVATCFLLGLANDELGYILAEEDFDLPLYQYERSMSVGRALGTQVVQNLMGIMKASE
jgi:hypothetical protein